MPTAFHVFPESEVVVTRLIGAVTISEYRELYVNLKEAEGYSPYFPEISDFRAVEKFEFGHEELRRLAQKVVTLYESTQLKTAILAANALSFGMARTYQTYASLRHTEQVEVFDGLDAATSWLGVTLTPADLRTFEAYGLPCR